MATATAAPTKATHEIQLVLDKVQGPVPEIPASMNTGETVHYFSKDGPVIVVFMENGSPFVDANGYDITVITDAAPPLALSKKGTFKSRCYITLSSGMTVGWGPNYPDGGGNNVVR
jgi:hypothetical protein